METPNEQQKQIKKIYTIVQSMKVDHANVHLPTTTSLILANQIEIKQNETVLDIGTGTGIQSLIAMMKGASKVTGIDINPNAINISNENAKLLKIENKTEFIVGDLFDPVKTKKYDVIISNPPQTPFKGFSFEQLEIKNGEKKVLPDLQQNYWLAKAYDGGKDGTKVIIKLLKQAKDHLNKNGRLYFTLLGITNEKKILKELQKDYNYDIIKNIEIPFDFERMRLFEGINKAKQSLCFKDAYPYTTLKIINATPK